MVKAIRPAQVERFVVSALKKANRTYCELSGGEWVTQRGVESFLAYFVAQPFQKFFSPRKACVLLEVSQRAFQKKYIQGSKWPTSKKWPSRSRFDIVILRKSGLRRDALGVIELKRDEFFDGWKDDIERVASIVAQCRKTNRSEFQFGCFAALVAEEKTNDEWICKQLSERWTALMKKTAEGKKIEVRIFDPSFSRFEPYEYLDDREENKREYGEPV